MEELLCTKNIYYNLRKLEKSVTLKSVPLTATKTMFLISLITWKSTRKSLPVRDFLLAKKDDGLKATTLNLYNSAIRFFYRNVLHVLWDDITVPRMIIEHKLPTVLSTDEIDRLLDATDGLKYKAMFATMYSSGMRVSEVIHLHYDDISRTNMQIHVRDTKNRMDRYTILPERNLALLTEYWFRKGRPKGILFPNQFTGQYLTVSTLEQVIRRSASAAGLSGVTPHCLRHSFATHLME